MTSMQDFWQRSLDWITSAKREESLHADLAASAAYYAAFYALSALFAMNQKLFNSHDGIEIVLHRDFIKTEILSPSVGVGLRKLRQFRRIGNYGGGQHVSPEDVRESLQIAQMIIETVYGLHPTQFIRPSWLS